MGELIPSTGKKIGKNSKTINVKIWFSVIISLFCNFFKLIPIQESKNADKIAEIIPKKYFYIF